MTDTQLKKEIRAIHRKVGKLSQRIASCQAGIEALQAEAEKLLKKAAEKKEAE